MKHFKQNKPMKWGMACLLLFALLVSQTAWAQTYAWSRVGFSNYGSYTYNEHVGSTTTVARTGHVKFSDLKNNTTWGDGSVMDNDNLSSPSCQGTRFAGTAPQQNDWIVTLTLFNHDEVVPAYTQLKRTSTIRMVMATNRYPHGAALYRCDTQEQTTTSSYYLCWDQNQSNTVGDPVILRRTDDTGDHTWFRRRYTMYYDNKTSAQSTVQKWIMMVHSAGATIGAGMSGEEWAGFREDSVTLEYVPCLYITYNGNGANKGSMYDQTIAGTGTLRDNGFTRSNYAFAGWNTAADGSGTAYANKAAITVTDAIKGAPTLYAQWTPSLTITFNSNGGSGSMSNQTITGSGKLNSNTFTRSGYHFTGWNTAADGSGTSYSNAANITATDANKGSVTYYAQWEKNTLTVKFDNNGGTGSMSDQTIEASGAITTNAFTRNNYTFTGWNTAANGTGTAYADNAAINVTTDNDGKTLTLYAQWKPYTLTVAFNGNGGTGSMSNQVVNISANLNAYTFTLLGHHFTGWNTAADGSGTAYADEATINVTSDSNGKTLTLYAQWAPYSLTVAFDKNGGEGTMADQNVAGVANLNANTFTLYCYHFTGWNTAADGSGTAYEAGAQIAATSDGDAVTLYAQWAKNTLTVNFNNNGGSGSMSNQNIVGAANLNANNFTRSGYRYTGWNTAANGTGTAYADGAEIIATTDGTTVTLYAQWAANTVVRIGGANDSEISQQSGSSKPFSTTTACGTTLTIYSSSQIGGSGVITNISYYVKNASSLSTTSVKIYMKMVESSMLVYPSNYDVEETLSDFTLVYSGNPTLGTTTGWQTFYLTNPFDYDDAKNLVVAVCRESNSANSSLTFANFTPGYAKDFPLITIFKDGASSYFGALSAQGFNESKGGDYFQPCIKLEMLPAPRKKAVYNGSNKLTFYYDEADHTAEGTVYSMNSHYEAPAWETNASSITEVEFDASFAATRPISCYHWFNGCSNLTTITGLSNLNTSSVISMFSMFAGCSKLTSLDLSSFNTANVTDMGSMFYNCKALTSLNLSSFNTEKVTKMSYLFYSCSALTSIDLSSFNTAKVTTMGNMFYNCKALTSIDLSSFNTANVWDMQEMFSHCEKLTSLDVSSFNTVKVSHFWSMFNSCYKLTSLTIGNFDMRKTVNASSIITGDSNLKNLTLKAVPFLYDNTINYKYQTWNTVNYQLDDNSVIYTGTNYLPAATVAPTYTRTIAAASDWGTVVLPFEAASDANVQLYTLSAVSGSELTFTPAATVAANTPCIFKKLTAGATSVLFTANSATATPTAAAITATDEVGGLSMNGTYTALTGQTDKYFVANNEIWKADAPISIAPFRAWFEGTPAGAPERLEIVEGQPVATSLVNSGEAEESVKVLIDGQVLILRGGHLYTLNGQLK